MFFGSFEFSVGMIKFFSCSLCKLIVVYSYSFLLKLFHFLSWRNKLAFVGSRWWSSLGTDLKIWSWLAEPCPWLNGPLLTLFMGIVESREIFYITDSLCPITSLGSIAIKTLITTYLSNKALTGGCFCLLLLEIVLYC